MEPIQAATYKAREQLHLKDREAQEARDRERKAASESNENSDVVKMQHSYWVWDAAKVARNALLELISAGRGNRPMEPIMKFKLPDQDPSFFLNIDV